VSFTKYTKLIPPAKGISGCFWFCIPLSALSFFITLFWIERVSLRRDDEARLKEEAKVWLAERKGGHQHGERGETTLVDEEKNIGVVQELGSSSVPISERTLSGTTGDKDEDKVGTRKVVGRPD
jgi:hypothetical protein